MKKSNKPIASGGLRYLRFLAVILVAILFYAAINNLGKVGGMFSFALDVLSPITIGICIAFVLNIPLRFFENKVFKKLTLKNGKIWSKLKRPLCLVLSSISILSVATLLLAFILPEFASTAARFFMELPEHMNQLTLLLRDWAARFNLPIDQASINIDWEWVSEQAVNFFNDRSDANLAQNAITLLVEIFNGFFNAILGIVFSYYILASKEKLINFGKSIIYSAFSKKVADEIVSVFVLSNKAFTGFISGQCIEVFLIGILCFVGMIIFGFPLPLMVSCVIAVTAFVPVFGPIAGAIVGAILILVYEPNIVQALLFVVFIIVLQQIESNIIYPRIMGKQVGLPGIWVLAAVTIGGGFFGVPGIILSVPICSVLYTLSQKWIDKRLKSKKISKDTFESEGDENEENVESDTSESPDEANNATTKEEQAEESKAEASSENKE